MIAFTLEEIQRHNANADDSWIVIHGIVYSISKFLEDHPGGRDILLEVAGQDATEFFDEALHSEDARSILPRLQIGSVKGFQKSDKSFDAISIPDNGDEQVSRHSGATVGALILAPFVVVTWLGLRIQLEGLFSFWTALCYYLIEANTWWLFVVTILVLSFAVLCFWASHVIYVDYGNLQKFPSRIRI